MPGHRLAWGVEVDASKCNRVPFCGIGGITLSSISQAQPSFRSEPGAGRGYRYGTPTAAFELTEFEDEFNNLLKICVVKQDAERRHTSALIERRYAWRGYCATPLPERVATCRTAGAPTGMVKVPLGGWVNVKLG